MSFDEMKREEIEKALDAYEKRYIPPSMIQWTIDFDSIFVDFL